MPPGRPADHRRRPPPQKESESRNAPTNTLWVWSLPSDAVDSDLMEVFGPHGALDCTAMLGGRRCAYVYFRTADEARDAKEALHGARIHGSPLKIDFTRPLEFKRAHGFCMNPHGPWVKEPAFISVNSVATASQAKPCKQIWIGGISSSTTKEQLEDEVSKFGEIEEYTFHRDRNSALVDYFKIEDAIAAQKDLNGKHLAGEQIRVDFMRPPPPRREGPDRHDSRDGNSSSSAGPEPWMSGPRRHPAHGGRGYGQPSNVLWIGYPPSIPINEEMLHNAMILFGEIERIKCFPSRQYCFVEFRSIDEARRAKEGLEGRLFNDPRIEILYSRSDVTPHNDNPPPFSRLQGPRTEIYFNDAPYGPVELFGHGRPMPSNSFSSGFAPPGSNMSMRSFGPQGPHHGGPEFHEFGGTVNNFPDPDLNNPMPSNWRRRSPSVPGMLPSASGTQHSFRAMGGEYDGFDMREPKRSRFDDSSDDAVFHSRRWDDEGGGEPFNLPHADRGAFGQSQHNRVVRRYGQVHGSYDSDHCWRGTIAKGGSDVCTARCVPIGTGIGSPFPKVINCSAKAGLDMLTKHYAEADGFDIVFFLPDSEKDFDAYTAFLRYLGQKDRAAVAKLGDGSTLFLVPPSDFLTKVLNVPGPQRLYGVVLKFPQEPITSATQQHDLAIPPHLRYVDACQAPDSQKVYNAVPQNEEQALKFGYGRPLHEGSMPNDVYENPELAHAVQPYSSLSSSQEYVRKPTVTSQPEVSITPELLATLASLIPGNIQPGSTGSSQMPLSSSVRPTSSTSVIHDGSMPVQGWRPEQQVAVSVVSMEQTSHPHKQLQYQYNNQSIIPQFQAYPNISSGPDHSLQTHIPTGNTISQDPSLNMQQAASVLTNPLNNYAFSSQGSRQFSAPQSNQQYQLDSSFTSHNSYGMLRTADATGVYNTSTQQPRPDSSSIHIQNETFSQEPQSVMTLPPDQVNMGFPAQGQQLQGILSSLGQGTSEGDADKNQRYQSTLQFAANLLLQLQQQQQVSGQVQGSASQQ